MRVFSVRFVVMIIQINLSHPFSVGGGIQCINKFGG